MKKPPKGMIQSTMTMYSLDECLFYLKSKLDIINGMESVSLKVFTTENLNKEVNVMRSVFDILSAVKQLREMPDGEEKEACLDMLLNSEAV